jgi:hypothetical protein
VQTYIHPNKILSISQGSMQTLPSGNMLVGYGYNGVVTEFSPSGKVLCDAFFEASAYLGSGDVQSYRAYKNRWTGLPTTPVDLALHDGIFYVSWLGATEVREWVLRSGFGDDEEWSEIARFRKDGFESHYTLPAEQRIKRWVKAYALGDDGQELGSSESLDVADQITMWYVHGPVEDKVEVQEEDDGEAEQEDESVNGYYSAAGAAMAVIGLCGMLVLLGLLAYLPSWRRGAEWKGVGDMFTSTSRDEEQSSSFLRSERGEMASTDAREYAWSSRADT